MWAFGLVVLAMVILTVVVGVIAAERKQARRELTTLIESTRAGGNSHEMVAVLEKYLSSEPTERLAQIARDELEQVLLAIDDADYSVVRELDQGAETDLDRLETELKHYLERQSEGVHHGEARARLARIPEERDERAFEFAAGNARTAGDDVGLRQGAWQAYLDEYPSGRHASEARTAIARAPDIVDEKRLTVILNEVAKKVAAGRLTEALLRIERGQTEVQSPARCAQLEQRADEIEATLEAVDAAACLKPIGAGGTAHSSKLDQCRLYLLCYSEGAHRLEVEAEIDRLLDIQRDELLQELRTRLETLADNPRAALRAVHEFLAHPAARETDLSRELTRLYVECLHRSLNESLRDLKVIFLKDGSAWLGEIAPVSQGWLQIKPRETSASGPRKARLVEDTDASISEPALLKASEHLHESVFAGSEIDSAGVIRELHTLRDLAVGAEYWPERLAVQGVLAELDPTDDAARRELSDAGYVDQGGVYGPVNPLTAAEAAQSPHQKTLEYYAGVCRSTLPREELLKLMSGSFDYRFLGATITVPIEWRMGAASQKLTLMTENKDLFHGLIESTQPLNAKRVSDENLPPAIVKELDEELESINATSRIEVIWEIEAVEQHLAGVGLEATRTGAALLVGEVFDQSSAAAAGVRVGDRIALVDGVEVTADATAETFATMIANGPQAGVKLVLVRSGRCYRVLLERSTYSVERYRMKMTIRARGKLAVSERATTTDWTDLPSPP